jgi:ribosomal protein S27AE
MVKEKKIYCPSCKKETGMTEESLRYLCITEDLKCPHCNAVVIVANKVTY